MKILTMFLCRLFVSMLVVSLVDGLLSPTPPTHSLIAMATLTAMLALYLMDLLSWVDREFDKHVIVYDDHRPSPPAK